MKIVYALIAICFVACSPGRMSVSEDLKSQHDAYSVKGRNGILINQKLKFGNYATTSIKRSWTKGNNSKFGIGHVGATQEDWVNIISVEYINRKQTINFQLSNGLTTSSVYGVSRFNAEDLEIGKNANSILNIGMDVLGMGGRSSSMFYVQIFTQQPGERPWEMIIDNQHAQAKPKTYTGYLAKSKTEYYAIVPVTKMEVNGKSGNTLLGSVGFEFRDPTGRAVAAVSLLDNGMVFLGKTTEEERFLLANACAALLLQEAIEG